MWPKCFMRWVLGGNQAAFVFLLQRYNSRGLERDVVENGQPESVVVDLLRRNGDIMR